MNIILPRKYFDGFYGCIAKDNYIVSSNTLSNKAYLSVNISFDAVEALWVEYAEKNKLQDLTGNITRIDDTLLIEIPPFEFEKGTYTYSSSGLSSLEEEKEFVGKITALLPELFDGETPISIEYNPERNNFFRLTPTIVIAPYYFAANSMPNSAFSLNTKNTWLCFGEFKEKISMPGYYEGEKLFPIKDNRSTTVANGAFSISSHKYGIGNTVFINSCIFSENIKEGISIYSLLEDVSFWKEVLIPLATTDFEDLKEILRNQELPIEIQAENYRTLVDADLLKDIEVTKARMVDAQKNIPYYSNLITNSKLDVERQKEILISKEAQLRSRKSIESLTQELNTIKTLPYIETMSIGDKILSFVTKPIQINDGPFLGGYKVEYRGVDSTVRVTNVVNPKEGLAHPHCSQGDMPCFGNYSDVAFRFESGDFLVGIELMYIFLSAYNPEDEWGQRMIFWDAKYMFEDCKERGIHPRWESYASKAYYSLYGSYPENGDYYCPCCEQEANYCDCDRCSYCNGLITQDYGDDSCNCDRCEECNELIDDNCEPHCMHFPCELESSEIVLVEECKQCDEECPREHQRNER